MAPKLNDDILHAAIEGLEEKRRKLAEQIDELKAMLSSGSRRSEVGAESNSGSPQRRRFSPEAIERMRAAQARRWAKVRGEAAPPVAAPVKPKRKLSAQARARLVANLKKARAAKAAKAKAAGRQKSAKARKAAPRKVTAKTAPATAQAAG